MYRIPAGIDSPETNWRRVGLSAGTEAKERRSAKYCGVIVSEN